jgi:hypothetical protein
MKNMRTFLQYMSVNIGILVGWTCALICLALFSVVESAITTLSFDGTSSFVDNLSFMFPLIIIYGGVFVFIPSGFGGYILEMLIRSRLKKGLLTEKWAAISGVLLAGCAIMLTCGVGLVFLMVAPHNGWQFLVNDLKDGVFFTNLPYYMSNLIKRVTQFLPEILTATILACVSGGLAGKYLARNIINDQAKSV